ncbi:MAG: hypothetical protein DRH32_03910, partial [Deltaproteobacteria bacterium]
MARQVINTELVKTRVVTVFSEKTGGRLAYESTEISVFPRSCIVLHSVNFSIPEKISGNVDSLTLYPKLLSLLTGKFQIKGFRAMKPDLTVFNPELGNKKQGGKSGLAEIIGPAGAMLGTLVPNLGVDIEQGQIAVPGKNGPVFSFREISARMIYTEGKSTIRLVCQSNLWDTLSVNVESGRKNSGISGQVTIHGFRPHRITGYLFPRVLRKISDSQVNLAINFQGKGTGKIQGDITGDIPGLTLKRGKARTDIEARSIRGAFQINRDIMEVTIDKMVLSRPGLELSGKLQKDRSGSGISLELAGRDINVDTARKTMLAVAGDIPVIVSIFDIVKSGTVPLITCTTRGNSLADLGKLKNLTIKARLDDGSIFVPGIRRDLDKVKGDVVISDGILEGKNLAAQLGNSRGKNGSLKIGLSGGKTPFHLDIMINADLVQLPPVLRQVISHKKFLKELDLIDKIRGNATGRLILGESLKAIKTRVTVDNFSLSGRYKRIPCPLEISGGRFSYDADGITVDNLKGKTGNSAFSSLAGRIDFNGAPFIDVSAGRFILALEEFYPWITAFDIRQIPKKIQSAGGRLTVSQMHLKGPLLDPAAWKIDAVGHFRDLVLDSDFCPDTVTAKNGHFHAAQDTHTAKIAFSDTQLTFLDAALTLSGLININFNGSNKFEALFKGNIGPVSNQWISARLHIPPELAFSTPLSVSSAYVSREKKGGIIFTGDLKFPHGPDLYLDIVRTPEEFRIKDVTIRDAESRASAMLSIKGRTLDFNFQGHITKSTSDRIFTENNLPDGWIDGYLNAHIRLDQPMKSTVQGKLKGGGLKLLRILGLPLDINSITLTAEQNHIKLASAVIDLDKELLALKGDVLFSKDGLSLDMDLSSNGLNWNHVKKILQEFRHAQNNNDNGLLSGYPVTGVIRLKSDSLVYDKTVWQPFQAEIHLGKDSINVNVTHAEIHGISTPGEIVVKRPNGDLTLEFKTKARNQPLEPVVHWLSGGTEKITGHFDMDGVIRAQCPFNAIPTSLTGDFELTAEDGSIFRAVVLSNILTFLNTTEILFGKNPGIGKQGLVYKTIRLKATLDKGRLTLKEAVMDGASMELICQGYIDLTGKKLDLTVLVAPLKTVDR